MITAIEIENLRGIRQGKLEGLAPLTILTGPNACGKSTVLDALMIAVSPDPSDAVGRAVQRRPTVWGGARWLLGLHSEQATLKAVVPGERPWQRELQWFGHAQDGPQRRLAERSVLPPYSTIAVSEDLYADDATSGETVFGANNLFDATRRGGKGLSSVPFVRLVDSGLPMALQQSYSEVARSGRRKAVYELIAKVVPGFEELTILVEGDGMPRLYITSNGRSVPVGLAGDGIQAFIQLSLEIAVAPDGLVLIEEPEVYQHPSTLRQTGRVLLENVRRGVQIVLTTHSLELIDSIVTEAGEERFEELALFNLGLKDGVLSSGRRSGEDMAFARQTLENDLR